MKVLFAFQDKPKSNSKSKNIAFRAGLTAKIAAEIRNADVLEISNNLAKKGIPTDFKGNKVIAWCSEKTVDIIQQLNERFNAHLTPPNGIYAEDFEKLNVGNDLYGFCNLSLNFLKKESKDMTQPKTIFFNTFETVLKKAQNEDKWLYNWDYVNEIADENYKNKFKSTNNFLEPFVHEFTHVFHENHLQSQIGLPEAIKKIQFAQNDTQVENFNKKYGQKISKICRHALDDQVETVSCDMSRLITESLDKETLMPTRNPFIDTPYENLSFWQRINLPKPTNEEEQLKEILRNFWNGKFD